MRRLILIIGIIAGFLALPIVSLPAFGYEPSPFKTFIIDKKCRDDLKVVIKIVNINANAFNRRRMLVDNRMRVLYMFIAMHEKRFEFLRKYLVYDFASWGLIRFDVSTEEAEE